ncbi:MBL fold metallo-hydrolase [Shewanella sedimentimangrovi]|uniref:MBL fold metallo-hydrolase n=1 Tax=Shewanella sedimentimangrovi TaxID=2814293 RepID=A0ABX7QXG7_9GAMM|nr:MBL fold metallo-hydrolase [Shewanella sedimentimangrovi]QSX35929.1 MBL fold metallo-hydrolase [Shewanella sedimentimangrovi]
MKYLIIPVTPFQQNCTLLWCESSLKAAVVDPGGNPERIRAEISRLGLSLEMVLLTHGHLDHVGAAVEMAESFGVEILGPHEDDSFWLQMLPQQSQRFGFPPCAAFEPSRYLIEGDVISIGEERLEVLHCPGHTPGHLVFFHRADMLALVGDVLFNGSIGRTDFPRSNHEQLLHSIKNKLWPLGDVSFIPGHGPMSTFARERLSNPFVADPRFG